jgi:hypothetical protein
MSCASISKPPEPKVWPSFCAANTALAIITVGCEYPTRGRTCKIGNEYHIQAEYLPDKNGDWVPLRVPIWSPVKEGEIEFEKEFPDEIFNELEYLTGEDVLMEYLVRLKEVPKGRLQK